MWIAKIIDLERREENPYGKKRFHFFALPIKAKTRIKVPEQENRRN